MKLARLIKNRKIASLTQATFKGPGPSKGASAVIK